MIHGGNMKLSNYQIRLKSVISEIIVTVVFFLCDLATKRHIPRDDIIQTESP
jgi:hypothetical protein